MNKSEFISKLSDKANITKKDAENFTEAFIETIIDTLNEGDKVTITGFGNFEKKVREARVGRNPRTGENIDIPSSVLPVFKPGKGFKDALEK